MRTIAEILVDYFAEQVASKEMELENTRQLLSVLRAVPIIGPDEEETPDEEVKPDEKSISQEELKVLFRESLPSELNRMLSPATAKTLWEMVDAIDVAIRNEYPGYDAL